MTSFLPTIIAAVIVVALALCGLGIGYLLTGKNRLKKRCGWTPKSDNPDDQCTMCGRKSPCDESDKDESE
jgi:hypothetical protein